MGRNREKDYYTEFSKMIESIIVYGFMIACFLYYGTSAGKYQKKHPGSKFWTRDIWIILFVFTFFCGVRNNVGVDWWHYMDNYVNPDNEMAQSHEWLYRQVASLMSGLGIHYAFYFALIAFLQLFFILYAFKDERYIYPLLLFVFMTHENYFMWMNAMRQCLVISLFLFAIRFLKKEEPIKYLLIIGISFFIHKSAVLLVPFALPFFSKDLFKNRLLQFILLGVAVALINIPTWNSFMDLIEVVGNAIGLGDENRSIEERFMLYEDFQKAIGPRFYATVVIGAVCIFYSTKVKKTFNINLFYNLFYIGLLTYVLFYNSPILSRACLYFTCVMFVTIAYTLYYLIANRREGINYLVFISIIAILLLYFLVMLYSNWYTYYYFIWQKAGPITAR